MTSQHTHPAPTVGVEDLPATATATAKSVHIGADAAVAQSVLRARVAPPIATAAAAAVAIPDKKRTWMSTALDTNPTTLTKPSSSKQAMMRLLTSRLAVCIIVTVLSAAILAALNPPIVQQKSKDKMEQGRRSVGKIAIVSVLAGLVALGLPYCVQWMTKGKNVAVVGK